MQHFLLPSFYLSIKNLEGIKFYLMRIGRHPKQIEQDVPYFLLSASVRIQSTKDDKMASLSRGCQGSKGFRTLVYLRKTS